MEEKTYKVKHLKGTVRDFATQYWTEEDHAKHDAYIEELKRTNEYLKPVTLTFSLVENPHYDAPRLPTPTLESSSMIMLDFSKENTNE